MQFPWRWLLCLSLIFSHSSCRGCVALVGAGCGLLACCWLLIAAGQRFQTPWWDNAADLREMQDNMADGIGYEGTGRIYAGGRRPGVDREGRAEGRGEGPAHAAIHVLLLECGIEIVHGGDVGSGSAGAAAVLLSGVEGGGEWARGQTTAREGTGQMLVPVEAGMNRVQIKFYSHLGSDGGRVDLVCRRSSFWAVSVACCDESARPRVPLTT